VLDPEKRESILEAACRAFERLGFRKASIGDIAEGAGVGKGTVYLACESKEDLFYQVILRDLRRFAAEQADRIDPRRPADELLRELSLRSIEHLERRPLLRWLISGAFHVELPRWVDRFEQLRDLSRANVTEVLRIGQQQGLFRDDLDIAATAELLHEIQFAAYIVHLKRGRKAGAGVIAKVERGLDLVLNGLKAR
jgi:AcrR family transcriptional regulator